MIKIEHVIGVSFVAIYAGSFFFVIPYLVTNFIAALFNVGHVRFFMTLIPPS